MRQCWCWCIKQHQAERNQTWRQTAILPLRLRASGLGLRFKTADCRRGGCLTPPIPAVFIPLHCRAASEPLRWLALSFRYISTLESSETGRMNRLCHASCRAMKPASCARCADIVIKSLCEPHRIFQTIPDKQGSQFFGMKKFRQIYKKSIIAFIYDVFTAVLRTIANLNKRVRFPYALPFLLTGRTSQWPFPEIIILARENSTRCSWRRINQKAVPSEKYLQSFMPWVNFPRWRYRARFT